MTGGRRFDPLGDPEEYDDDPATGAPDSVGHLLGAMARRRRWGERLRGARIHDVWEDVAGPDIARHVEPVRLHGGILVLRADSAAWATQLQYLGPQLVERSNELLGGPQVREVRIVTGGGEERSPSDRRRRP